MSDRCRKIRIWSAGTAFLAAQCVPAFWSASHLVWGFQATVLSFVGAIQVTAGELFPEHGRSLACVTGAFANVFFLIALVGALRARPGIRIVVGKLALISGVAATVSILTGSEQFIPHVGCLLWITALALLPE
jgi:hypothetical protein